MGKGLRTKEHAEITKRRGPGTHPHRKSFSSPGQRYMLQVTLALTNSTSLTGGAAHSHSAVWPGPQLREGSACPAQCCVLSAQPLQTLGLVK